MTLYDPIEHEKFRCLCLVYSVFEPILESIDQKRGLQLEVITGKPVNPPTKTWPQKKEWHSMTLRGFQTYWVCQSCTQFSYGHCWHPLILMKVETSPHPTKRQNRPVISSIFNRTGKLPVFFLLGNRPTVIIILAKIKQQEALKQKTTLIQSSSIFLGVERRVGWFCLPWITGNPNRGGCCTCQSWQHFTSNVLKNPDSWVQFCPSAKLTSPLGNTYSNGPFFSSPC